MKKKHDAVGMMVLNFKGGVRRGYASHFFFYRYTLLASLFVSVFCCCFFTCTLAHCVDSKICLHWFLFVEKVRRVPDTLNLHQAKFAKGARILWELAIAFSPRLSEAAEKRIDEEGRRGEFAVRGGRMYTEIIRIWDIVFQWNEVRAVCLWVCSV